jgi:hypothetical protein
MLWARATGPWLEPLWQLELIGDDIVESKARQRAELEGEVFVRAAQDLDRFDRHRS